MFDNLISGTSLVIKIGILAVIFLYVIFAFVIINQIRVLGRSVRIESTTGILVVLGWIHFLLSIFLFVLAIVIL